MTARLYTTAEAAELLNISVSYLQKAAAARAIPHTRPAGGRVVRFSEDDLAAIVRAGQVQPVASFRQRRSA